MPPIDPANVRILEIGHHAVMKTAFPKRTRLLWTFRKWAPRSGEGIEPFSLRALRLARQDIRAGRIDLVVVWVEPYAPWNWRMLRRIFERPFRPLATLVHLLGVQAVRLLPRSVPVIAIDNEDLRTIGRHSHFLLDRARYFFKRELPVDRWQVFQHTAHAGLPGARFRRAPRNRRRIGKLRPISIGCESIARYRGEIPFPEKSADVFVSLTLEGGTTVRNEGIAQIRALAAEGIRVDLPAERLSREEFMHRMGRAWLTWSPEGLGWDTFRHYEAPLACTVPVINQPVIVRYRPLIEGVHAFYYQPDEPGGLQRVIRAALADRERLRTMAVSAREHVLAHHVRPRPLADALVRMGLGLEEAPGGVDLEIGSHIGRAIDSVAEQRNRPRA